MDVFLWRAEGPLSIVRGCTTANILLGNLRPGHRHSVFKSILIANRGEIAVRIARACRDLGIESVAVYSDPDRTAPHVTAADRAFHIGAAPAAESYLVAERLIDTALSAGAEAIHPGDGFLAERAPFAELVANSGLTFIGPRASTIAGMGDKTEARQRMQAAGVPIVPGVVDAVATSAEAIAVAREIGFPVLLKAAAGGGGKGMRVVHEEDEVARAFDAATREALASFGDGAVYVERYLEKPRHIEVQVLGDTHGRVLHLGERECSIQRRHQKLVEEAPSAVLTPELRAQMGEAAVKAAEAVDYVGAGTIEFLLQGDEFFFLEMNTRLQVEHPVTELVTGIDLVEWQIRVAAGEPLPWTQEDIKLEGHALECRITSEDVDAGFLPSTGKFQALEIPEGPGVRWDGGVAHGFEVGLFYDPLLGKLVTYGADRDQAIRRMRRALRELRIDGVSTCTAFHRRVMDEADFCAGRLSIRYIEDHPELLEPSPTEGTMLKGAVVAAMLEHERRAGFAGARNGGPDRDARRFGSWRELGMPWARKD